MKTTIGIISEDQPFELNLNDYRGEHISTCLLGDKCQSCRVMMEDDYISRIQLARDEFIKKIVPLQYLDGLLCVYCGAHSEQRDHLLPRNWTGDALRPLIPTVPSCRFCNSSISDFCEPQIAARSKVVAQRIRVKFGRQLKFPMRSERELAEFGRSLRLNLQARQLERVELHAKLVVLDLGGVPELPENWIEWLTIGNYDKFLDKELNFAA
jgi:hypothetical protein